MPERANNFFHEGMKNITRKASSSAKPSIEIGSLPLNTNAKADPVPNRNWPKKAISKPAATSNVDLKAMCFEIVRNDWCLCFLMAKETGMLIPIMQKKIVVIEAKGSNGALIIAEFGPK